jgi:hypothetical protein
VADRSARWPSVGGAPGGGLSSGRRRRAPGGRARSAELRAAGSGGGGGGGEPGRGWAGGGDFDGTAAVGFAVVEVTRTEKKRAKRKVVCGYFLARRQDLWHRARCHTDCHVTQLGAIGCGAELCYLGATSYGAELRVQTCKLNFWGSKRKFLSRKGLKNKKFGVQCLWIGYFPGCYTGAKPASAAVTM